MIHGDGSIATELMQDRKNEGRAAKYYYKIDQAGRPTDYMLLVPYHVAFIT
jgi:hypothetical protein